MAGPQLSVIMIIVNKDVISIRKACLECIQNKLYLSDGMFLRWYRSPSRIELLVVKYSPMLDKPISSGILLKSPDISLSGEVNVGVFVHKDFRRKGLGSSIIKAIKEHTTVELLHYKGQTASIFFNKALGNQL